MSPDATANATASGLTSAQVGDWDRDGFLVFDQFVDAETLAALRTAYDQVLSGEAPADGDRQLGNLTRQVMIPSSAHPTFDQNAVIDLALEMAAQLLRTKDVSRAFDMLIYKPPGHPHETPWHQDSAYGGRPFAEAGTPLERDSIQFWIPLDDVDTDTGCMQFIADTRADTLFEHHVASGEPDDESRLLALVDPSSQLDLSKAVVAEIPAGGATLHTGGTLHYTGPNRSADRHRRSYIFNIRVTGSE